MCKVQLETSGMSVDEAIEWARQKIKEESELEQVRQSYPLFGAGINLSEEEKRILRKIAKKLCVDEEDDDDNISFAPRGREDDYER